VTENPEGRLGTRLRRILLLLPHVIRNPGVTVEELAEKLEATRRELLEDLDLLFLCGLPGYGPGDLIDVSVEDDRVYVQMADYFKAPLRLMPAEALALHAGGEAIAALPGMEEADALRRALDKLGRAIGAGHDAGIALKMEAEPAPHLGVLEDALSRRVQVDIEYLSASSGGVTTRTIDPWGLFNALGHWYVIAWDHASSDERMFRVDRIKSVAPRADPAEVPEDFDPERYRGAFLGGGEVEVSLEISPETARWFEDYYPVTSAQDLSDGWRAITLTAGGMRWAAIQALKLGEHARAVSPKGVVTEAAAIADRLAKRYRASVASS
jgi:proteasome accessory factor C